MYGGFFLQKLRILEIIEYLGKTFKITFELSKSKIQKDFIIQAVCDSRLGGDGCLAFVPGHNREPIGTISYSLVIVDEFRIDDAASNVYCRVDDARAVFIDLLSCLQSAPGIEPHYKNYQAEASIDKTASIASNAVIESGVSIGRHVVVGAGAIIKSGTRIADLSRIGENVCIGNNGIGLYKAADGRLLNFPHIAGVSIGYNTEIGAGSVIPSGILSSTQIGDNVVIGNLCNIGHSARVGDSVWMSVGVLIGGHTTVGSETTIGMGVTVRDNRDIGRAASIGMGSVVVKNVNESASMFGNPAKRVGQLSAGPKR